MFIWAHGAAQGVWKERTRRVVGSRVVTCVLNSSSEVTSRIFDMVGCGVGVLVVCVNGGVNSRAQRALLDAMRACVCCFGCLIRFCRCEEGTRRRVDAVLPSEMFIYRDCGR